MPETPHPQFVKLEYLGPDGWEVGHHGINLLYPERYVDRLVAKGKTARVTIVDTGQVFTSELPPACSICGSIHSGPDGGCLL